MREGNVGRGHAKETRLRKTLSAASALRKQVSVFFLFPKCCAETVPLLRPILTKLQTFGWAVDGARAANRVRL